MKKRKHQKIESALEFRLSGTIRVSEDQEEIRIEHRERKIRKGNPVSIPNGEVIAVGTVFGAGEFDIARPEDIVEYRCQTIRKLKLEEVCLIGDLKTTLGQSRIKSNKIYVEPETDEEYEELLKLNGKGCVLEGDLVRFTFPDNEECGMLIKTIHVLMD